jgi:Xaa-Pro aminopeptidase
MAGAKRAEIGERLARVRAEMARDGVQLYLVPSSDAHQNEYVPRCWQRRAWISGFTGSAGDVVVGTERAWLWTDSRYWLQAQAELDAARFELMRSGAPDVLPVDEWLGARSEVVAFDPRLLSVRRARTLREALARAGGELRTVERNYIDEAWTDQPPLPVRGALRLDVAYTGRSVEDKLGDVRRELAGKSCDALALTMLDAIAWLFNLRGSDVDYNPLLIAYAMVTAEGATLYTETAKIGEDLLVALGSAGVRVEPYEAFAERLRASRGKLWLDPAQASAWVGELLERSRVERFEARSPVELLKARKNPVEQAGMRSSHVRDGVALVRFLHWLEGAWRQGLDEVSAAERLDAFRREGERFRDLSFPTISGFGPNGAIVHYRATRETARRIDDRALYLIDSGAHYLDGTTDVTRTVHLGRPTRREREHYTRVLQGHLALRNTVFPKGTTGAQLDPIARRPLWEVELDYGHGTGHGVGCYLNVHEGPQAVAARGTEVGLEPGMVVSNEPGLYVAGEYGIRIENLLLVTERSSAGSGDARPFYCFDDLTLVPYARRLIETSSLAPREREAIDAYHARVFETLAPRLAASSREWLRRETAPLDPA